jgi:hypothetical protein
VTDANDAVIVGAKVEATNIATQVTYSGETNGEGFFVIANLPTGRYRIVVQKQGFQSVIKPDVDVHVQDVISLNFSMQVGSITQSVTVEAGASLAQTETAAVDTLVDRQFVENLPLNGRSFQSLIALTPGVVLTKANFNEQGQFSANGQRANANYFMVDGVSANIGVSAGITLGQSGGGSLPGFSAFGGTSNLVSVDALQEFRVQTSTFAPEFGRTPGAQVSIVTRSGTNDFHGALFEYFRNDVLDANDWFANSRGQRKPALRQNDFGAVVGGPVIKNRAFFFFSYEGLRLRQPQTALTTVPSMSARQSAPAQIRPFLSAFPVPNGRELGNGLAEFSAGFSNSSTLDATGIRVDYAVNQKLTLFGRYNNAPSETVQRGASGLSLTTVLRTPLETHTFTSGAILGITPTINNDFRANYSRTRAATSFAVDDFGGATPPSPSMLFPSFASPQDSFYQFVLIGGTGSIYIVGKNADNSQRQINLVDNLSIVASDHQLKFGVDYRRLSPVFDPARYSLAPIFLGVPAALTGRASFVSISASAGPRSPLFKNFSAYGQDTWKASPRLTFTYGLRWEVNPPPSEKNGEDPFAVDQVDNPALLALAPRGTSLWQTTYDNFAPRVGFAYQLSQRQGGESVLRGGFGIFFDLGTGTSATAFANGFPYVTSKLLFGVPYPLDAAQASPPRFSLDPPVLSIAVFDPKLKLPYVYQWNLSLEQSLGLNQTVSASYVAAVGRRLLRQELFRGPALGNNSIFTPGSFVNVTRNAATSDYHALQLQFQRRLSRGLQALGSYTWSHSIDTASNDSSSFAPAAIIDPKADRGPSDFDVRHSFTSAVTYNVPTPEAGAIGNAVLRNWSVDTIFRARTATPVNVITGTAIFGVSDVFRPDLVLGVPLYVDDPAVAGGRRINRAAFSAPPTSRQGTLGRNALRGFGASQLDLALRRQFNLSERANLQFRAEFFNILNHPNFGDPGAGGSNTNNLTTPLFGQSILMLGTSLGSGGSNGGFSPLYQIGGPRSIQFGLKLKF